MGCDKKDLEVLAKQLGRKPRNVVEVAKYCRKGYPQVIVTAPLLKDKSPPGIFPTTFWLTCPELNYRISQLEEEGWIKKLEEKAAQQEKLAEELEKAHQNYIKSRLDLVNKEEINRLKDKFPGQYRVLTKAGVGGILNPAGIKCLHTHYAHYLAEDNPIGRQVAKLLKDDYGDLDPKTCSYKCEREG